MVVYIVYGCVYSLLVFLVLFIFRNVALLLCCSAGDFLPTAYYTDSALELSTLVQSQP